MLRMGTDQRGLWRCQAGFKGASWGTPLCIECSLADLAHVLALFAPAEAGAGAFEVPGAVRGDAVRVAICKRGDDFEAWHGGTAATSVAGQAIGQLGGRAGACTRL